SKQEPHDRAVLRRRALCANIANSAVGRTVELACVRVGKTPERRRLSVGRQGSQLAAAIGEVCSWCVVKVPGGSEHPLAATGGVIRDTERDRGVPGEDLKQPRTALVVEPGGDVQQPDPLSPICAQARMVFA